MISCVLAIFLAVILTAVLFFGIVLISVALSDTTNYPMPDGDISFPDVYSDYDPCNPWGNSHTI